LIQARVNWKARNKPTAMTHGVARHAGVKHCIAHQLAIRGVDRPIFGKKSPIRLGMKKGGGKVGGINWCVFLKKRDPLQKGGDGQSESTKHDETKSGKTKKYRGRP